MKNQWLTEILIQTEIDYEIKKRIIHLDETYFWDHEKKNRNQSVNMNTQFLPLFTRYRARFTATRKCKKEKGQLGTDHNYRKLA